METYNFTFIKICTRITGGSHIRMIHNCGYDVPCYQKNKSLKFNILTFWSLAFHVCVSLTQFKYPQIVRPNCRRHQQRTGCVSYFNHPKLDPTVQLYLRRHNTCGRDSQVPMPATLTKDAWIDERSLGGVPIYNKIWRRMALLGHPCAQANLHESNRILGSIFPHPFIQEDP